MKKKIILIGDSHVYDFHMLRKRPIETSSFNIIKVVSIAGKTAQGLAKKNNSDLYIKKIKDLVKETDMLGINIGETDCGYALWSRMKIHKTTQEEEILFAINNLLNFAKELRDLGFKNIFFMGPIIPLVTNYKAKNIPALIRKRRKVGYSYKERTNLVLSFNKKLKKEALKAKYKYIHINDSLLDKKNGVAKIEFQDGTNFHHLKPLFSFKFWSSEINKLIKQGIE